MERIRAMVAALEGAPKQCSSISQVRFNSWRYACDSGDLLVEQ